MRARDRQEKYRGRLLSERLPGMEERHAEHKVSAAAASSRLDSVLARLGRIVDLSSPARIAVLGCGPSPTTLRRLLELGHDALGIEPVAAHARRAVEFIGDERRVVIGSAEKMPLEDRSQDVVLMESVLEHVESVSASLAEAYRVLAPGGVLHVVTTNRFSLTNGEFHRRFFQWYPGVVKESYVFEQLHFRPELADFSTRPAVHWFSFAELCQLGRDAGFAQFYSPIDLVTPESPSIRKSAFRRSALDVIQWSPWTRAAFLVLFGHTIEMLKRREPARAELSVANSADGMR